MELVNGRPALVGRSEILDSLVAALARAQSGAGQVVLLRGEAGIGKTRLAEELAEHAQALKLDVLWGRAWEAGGAPPYWPWIEALRALLRARTGALDALSASRRALLSQLLPELDSAAPALSAQLPAEQARFALLESVVAALCDAAAARPLMVVLEDMHAAESDSLLALELMAAQARGSGLLVLATARPAALSGDAAGLHLVRVGRLAASIELERLDEAETRALVQAVLGPTADPEAPGALYRMSEGNPLFLIELARWVTQRRTLSPSSELSPRALPQGVRAVIEQRISALPYDSVLVLQAAAIWGREFDEAGVVSLHGGPEDQVRQALVDALDAQVIEPQPGGYRFSHVLLRDVVYTQLDGARRQALHLKAADVLLRRSSTAGSVPWSGLAHHLLRSGTDQSDRAAEAARCAADAAAQRLAFDEAAEWMGRALDAHKHAPAPDPLRTAELTLALARITTAVGRVPQARTLCVQAAQLARAHGHPLLLAHAALEYGRAFTFAEIDGELISLLEEALACLPGGQAGLRARLSARLAAALQPAEDPQGPIAKAREALALARTLEDPQVRLETLLSVTSCMADLGDPRERMRLNEELCALASELHEPFEELRGAVRLTFDCAELGDMSGAGRAALRVQSLAERLDVPHARWLSLGLSGMLAAFYGRLDEAEALAQRALHEAQRAQDPNGLRALGLGRVCALRLSGRLDEAIAALPDMLRTLADLEFGRSAAYVMEEALRAMQGRPGGPPRTDHIDYLVALGDPSFAALAGVLAFERRDGALAARLSALLRRRQNTTLISWGALGLCIDLPLATATGLACAAQGDDEPALEQLRAGVAKADELDARTLAIWARYWLARALHRMRDPALREALQSLTQETRARARAHGVTLPARGPFAETARRRESTPPAPSRLASSHGAVRLERCGERWTLWSPQGSFSLEDTKGVRYLSLLLAAPGKAIHVFELLGTEPSQVDRGDAGELLDARAIAQYRARIRALQAQIHDAESSGEDARKLAARAELEALEEQLAYGLGLGGRARKGASQAERARINVQRRVRDALRRIESHAPELARQLSRCIKTGTVCSYDP